MCKITFAFTLFFANYIVRKLSYFFQRHEVCSHRRHWTYINFNKITDGSSFKPSFSMKSKITID